MHLSFSPLRIEAETMAYFRCEKSDCPVRGVLEALSEQSEGEMNGMCSVARANAQLRAGNLFVRRQQCMWIYRDRLLEPVVQDEERGEKTWHNQRRKNHNRVPWDTR